MSSRQPAFSLVKQDAPRVNLTVAVLGLRVRRAIQDVLPQLIGNLAGQFRQSFCAKRTCQVPAGLRTQKRIYRRQGPQHPIS